MTEKELLALKLIRADVVRKGQVPSVRDLMRSLKYKSPRSAAVLMERLEDHGLLIKRNDGSYKLVEDRGSLSADVGTSAQTKLIPLLGAVACGAPILAEENVEAELAVSTKLLEGPNEYYLLRATGDSMNEHGINDGDIVLVRQQLTANDGDIVVALIDDEATVKELKRSKGCVVLMPRSTNKAHLPIVLSVDFKVQGVVTAVIPGV